MTNSIGKADSIGSASKFLKNKPALFGGVAVLILLALWIFNSVVGVHYQTIVVSGTIQAKEISVASKIAGRISRVFANEGQEVKEGDPLVEFQTPELDAKREQLKASISKAKADLEMLQNGPRQAEIDKARANAAEAFSNWQMLKSGYRHEEVSKAKAQRQEAESNLNLLERGYREEEVRNSKALMDEAAVDLEFQKSDWERYQKLSTQGAVRGRDRDEAKSRYDGAQKKYEAARETFNKMSKGPRQEEISAARERAHSARAQESMFVKGPRDEEIESARQKYLSARESARLLEQGSRKEEIAKSAADEKQKEAELQELDAQLLEKTVKAPVNAEISVMDLHKGEVIAAGKAVATLTKLDEVWTRVYVPERELGRVRVGETVVIRADPYPQKRFRGKIVQIPGVAEFTPRNVQTAEERSGQVFGLKITIDNKEHALRGGMNAEISLPPKDTPLEFLARRDDATSNNP